MFSTILLICSVTFPQSAPRVPMVAPAPKEATIFDKGLTTPPPPRDVKATIDQDTVVISWRRLSLAKIVGYEVHRKVGKEEFKLIGTVNDSTFTDRKVPSGPLEYAVVTVDSYQNRSKMSGAVAPAPKPR